jgi:hypothetical protein
VEIVPLVENALVEGLIVNPEMVTGACEPDVLAAARIEKLAFVELTVVATEVAAMVPDPLMARLPPVPTTRAAVLVPPVIEENAPAGMLVHALQLIAGVAPKADIACAAVSILGTPVVVVL